MCRQIFAMAIKAPVLPRNRNIGFVFFTASMASHIDDVRAARITPDWAWRPSGPQRSV
jgi:hypothetical protein